MSGKETLNRLMIYSSSGSAFDLTFFSAPENANRNSDHLKNYSLRFYNLTNKEKGCRSLSNLLFSAELFRRKAFGISRVLFHRDPLPRYIYHLSCPVITNRIQQSTRQLKSGPLIDLFDLTNSGGCSIRSLPILPVSSYLTFSTLLHRSEVVIFCSPFHHRCISATVSSC